MTAIGPEPTAPQRDAIRAAERHVLLAADIGTGKSFTLARRVLHLLGVPIEGVASREARARTLDEIAVITFTAAAAVELRDVLREALHQAGRDGDTIAVDAAPIGTVDHFCARLWREHALRAGRAPAPRASDHILVDTRDLLTERSDVLAAARRGLHTLIIDEYQDVDPVLHELAWLLADPVRGGATTPRLFLAGDPKRSIRRFQGAGVTLWREVERHFRGGAGEVISLSQNRSTVPAILNFVRATVGAELSHPLQGEELSAFEVPFADVTTVRGDPADPAVEVILIPPGTDGGRRRADFARLTEAEVIARRTREFNEAGIPWREMAVVLPAWNPLSVYADAFERHGIPHSTSGAEGFFERREVLDCLLTLRVLHDPSDDRALVGWLRSPFVALRDDTVFALAMSDTRPLAQALNLPGLPEAARRAWATELLGTCNDLRDRVSLGNLLESLLEHSGYLAHLAELGDRQAIANVRRLVARARHAGATPLGEFLHSIGERDVGERTTQARVYDAAEDAVTLTTVPAANGRQWDVVFWADVRDLSTESEEVVPLEAQAERKRFWYVAATRAKSHLVVSGVSQGHGKVTAGTAEDMLYRRIALLKDAMPGRYRVGRGSAGFALQLRFAAEPDISLKPAMRPPLAMPPSVVPVQLPWGRRRQSATALRLFERCPRRYWFRYVEGLPEPVERDRTGTDAVITGSLVHQVLEHLSVEADVAALITQVVNEARDFLGDDATVLQQYRDAVAREVAMVEEHAGYRALQTLPSARRELRFVELLGPDRVLEGVIDLVALTDGGYTLLDVKTGQGRGAITAERAAWYRVQADVYCGAVETIGGQPAIRFAFHFSRTGEQQVESLDPAARLAARERIRALLARIAAGERRLTDDPRECEQCGYRAAGWCPGVAPVSDAVPSGAAEQRAHSGPAPQFTLEL